MDKVLHDSSTIRSKPSPCPVCSRSGTLILRQINATEAMYVCDNPECFYPVGEEITIIKRAIPELMCDLERASALDCSLSSSADIDPAPNPGGLAGGDTCSGEESCG